MRRAFPFLIIGVVLVGAITVTAILVRNKRGAGEPNTDLVAVPKSTPTPADGGSQSQPSPNAKVVVTKPNVKISSPVILEEYGDYQCPPCGLLYPVLKEIEGEYGNQLRVVFHHFPITKLHKNAMAAARAAEAARNQNKFWEMHDRLYRNQKAWAEQADPRPIFISYARELGLKVDQFTGDMDSPQVEQRISADIQRASAMGVTGTPTVYIENYQLRYEATTPEGIRRGINEMMKRKAIS
jgi:protein-disulfide isomerase